MCSNLKLNNMCDARPPEFGVVVIKDVMVPMRDSVRMATDIYLPVQSGNISSDQSHFSGTFPALLERTPYDKSDPERVLCNGEPYSLHRPALFAFHWDDVQISGGVVLVVV